MSKQKQNSPHPTLFVRDILYTHKRPCPLSENLPRVEFGPANQLAVCLEFEDSSSVRHTGLIIVDGMEGSVLAVRRRVSTGLSDTMLQAINLEAKGKIPYRTGPHLAEIHFVKDHEIACWLQVEG